MSQQPQTLHPLVTSYLAELDRLLQGVDPAERAEVLEGVREHLWSSLADTAGTDDDVRRVLAELGPAQAVADEAYAGRPTPEAGRRVPATSRPWSPTLTAVLDALALLVVVGAAGLSAGVSTSTTSEVSAAGGPTTSVTESSFDGSIGSGIAALFAAMPFVLAVGVLVALSGLWAAREKALLVAVAPLAAVAFAVLPQVGYTVLGIDGVYVGAWLALGLSLVGGGLLVGVLTRRALRRSHALTA